MFIRLTDYANNDVLMINATQVACAQKNRTGYRPTGSTRVVLVNGCELIVEESVNEIHDRILCGESPLMPDP